MRTFLLSTIIIISSFAGFSQSYDDRIAVTMNAGDLCVRDSIDRTNIMFATDLSYIGYNRQAPDLTKTVLDATRESLDSVWTASLELPVPKYAALSHDKFYKIMFADSVCRIPFRTAPDGEERYGPVLHNSRHYNTPSFQLTQDKGPSILQTLGMITVGVARALINPDAPANPDL